MPQPVIALVHCVLLLPSMQVYAAKRAAAMRADEQSERDGGAVARQAQRKRKQAA